MLVVRIYFVAIIFTIQVLFSECYSKVEFDSDSTVEDLALYLGSLKKIVTDCSWQTHFTAPNYYFGLFIAKVNIQKALRDNSEKLDDVTIQYVEVIVEKINGLLRFIKVNELPNMTTIEKSIFNLIHNETTWIQGLRPLQSVPPNQRSQHGFLPDWKTYDNLVSDYEKGVPSPEQSDICLVSLSENQFDYMSSDNSMFPRCYMNKPCYDILVNGTNFGYFLTHRLLLVILANLGRGCSISSPEEDERIIRLFCSTARNEARYNMRHGYQSADLVLEQMSLCGLYGYPTITNRYWLNNFLTQQTTSGCFESPTGTRQNTPGLGRRRWFKNEKENGDLHMSSVTASTLGTMVRFILENY